MSTPPDRSWSIGIYRGPTPLDLASPAGLVNPVLTGRSVAGLDAAFVADPFMVRHRGGWHLFFEAYEVARSRGVIGVAESADAHHWEYRGIVLAEDFHLSYPYIFKYNGQFYMTPETLEHGKVRLYRCREFPDVWEPVADLVAGRGADPSPFFHDGSWWLFVCTPPERHATLRLYRADRLEGPWREHPASPVVADDPLAARPAGRVIRWRGTLVRFAQECRPFYGSRVRAYEILRLSASEYCDRPLRDGRPILGPGDAGWNRVRMHHLDAHRDPAGGWIACVDGNDVGPRRRAEEPGNSPGQGGLPSSSPACE